VERHRRRDQASVYLLSTAHGRNAQRRTRLSPLRSRCGGEGTGPGEEKIAKRGDLLDRLLVIITQGGKWEYNPTRWTITGADGIEFDTAMDDARLEIQDEFPPPDEPRKPGWEEEWEKRKPC
jgi:hypothetical protein